MVSPRPLSIPTSPKPMASAAAKRGKVRCTMEATVAFVSLTPYRNSTWLQKTPRKPEKMTREKEAMRVSADGGGA